MNKKILFLATGMVMATCSFAQKDKLKEANKELKKAQEAKKKPDDEAALAAYQKAKEAIDAASKNPETENNGDMWFTRAAIYLGMQDQSQLNADNPYREAFTALKKAFELNKKLESNEQAPTMMANAAFFAYNDGIRSYNNSNYEEAYNLFKSSVDMLGPDKDRRFILIPVIDTIRAQSKMFMGYTAFYDKKYDQAIPVLKEMKASPYLAGESNIYLILAQAYESKGNKEEQLATINEAKKKFPGDKNVDAAELNYFIVSGKQDEITAKLEEAAAKDPENPELQLNLGIIYTGMSTSTASGAAPANAAELSKKAETALAKAVSLAPANGIYNYQLGAFYFNKAADINTQMNKLGTSKEDQAKYNDMMVNRNELFKKALPSLEQSNTAFSARPNKLNAEERKFYHNCLSALKEIYVIQDDTEKAKAVRAKLEAMN